MCIAKKFRLTPVRSFHCFWLGLLLTACSPTSNDANLVDQQSGGSTSTTAGVVTRCESNQLCMTIDAAQQSTISPYIYGTNDTAIVGSPRFSFHRFGGNRLTAYNWENNASNAGEDYFNQSDSYLGGGNTPGEATRSRIASAHANNSAALITIPIQGYVAADKNGGGDVNQTANYLQTRFHQSVAAKASAFSLSPDLGDNVVYQDEFVNYLENLFPGAHNGTSAELFYSLDNEPALWASTHPRIQLSPVTYADLIAKSLETSEAIKDLVPNATIFGPVSYGWAGFDTLQSAPDAGGRDFLETYLDAVRDRSNLLGIRLVDVVDIHWYSEARGNGTRITLDSVSDAVSHSDPVAEARMQAPRSLWDSSYTEDSWIAQFATTGPIQLIPYLRDIIDRSYAGTKIAFSEYNHGGGNHISGAIAQADTLGIFAREGIFAANFWALGVETFSYAAFDMFRDFDSSARQFGDTALSAATSDAGASSVYASLDGTGRTILVVINKLSTSKSAHFDLANSQAYQNAEFFHLTDASTVPQSGEVRNLGGNMQFSATLPAKSITTIVLSN